jgi:hypothetical protein
VTDKGLTYLACMIMFLVLSYFSYCLFEYLDMKTLRHLNLCSTHTTVFAIEALQVYNWIGMHRFLINWLKLTFLSIVRWALFNVKNQELVHSYIWKYKHSIHINYWFVLGKITRLRNMRYAICGSFLETYSCFSLVVVITVIFKWQVLCINIQVQRHMYINYIDGNFFDFILCSHFFLIFSCIVCKATETFNEISSLFFLFLTNCLFIMCYIFLLWLRVCNIWQCILLYRRT